MRVAVFVMGTRGDAQPAAILGAELARRGHEVVLGLPEDLAHFGLSMGVETASIGVGAHDFMGSEEVRAWLASGDLGKLMMGFSRYKRQQATRIADAMAEISDGADLIVSGVTIEDEAACIAEWRGVPMASLHHTPMRANGAFPFFLASTRRFPRAVNHFMYHAVQSAGWRVLAADVNRLRARLGLRPTRVPTPRRLARAGATELQAYSRFLVPELAAWGPRRPLVGFLTLSAEQRKLLGEHQLDPAVDQWLDDGEPPAYFGFGSMPVQDPSRVLDLISTVARRLGLRALVSAGWSDIPTGISADQRVRVVGNLDHDTVLPRCRIAVHHGGAGTTAASVGAGLPTVVCSVIGDQPFWGAQLERLGIGATLRFPEMSERTLVRAAEPLLDREPRERAARLAAQLRSEDAAGCAADFLEKAQRS
ncbi:glycosyl transferase [Parafrankia colletiae]|uniref:Glycosyl transferase n=1 Tax=Parafrankia colletiae TaxID=573497 RepID=A0A1S1Q4J1_9ACTN|nr:glycosyltransferase [Parafrankia colletiae]MCK9903314.1 glycosyltransferase [Frankia sp. Cpl3]OHV29828.1 glycosyl transferase [Parafrankia colletiae]